LNNPLNDAIKCKELLFEELEAFKQLKAGFQDILFQLLHNQHEFSAFFKLLNFSGRKMIFKNLSVLNFLTKSAKILICRKSSGRTCRTVILPGVDKCFDHDFKESPDQSSITPPWVSRNYPDVEKSFFSCAISTASTAAAIVTSILIYIPA
jgi:ATP-dependent DNA helicase RecQ